MDDGKGWALGHGSGVCIRVGWGAERLSADPWLRLETLRQERNSTPVSSGAGRLKEGPQ